MNQQQAVTSKAELYDRYAPLVYGQIIRSVPCVPVAEDLLTTVFLRAFESQTLRGTALLSPLTRMLNDARNKTEHTLKAMRLFNESCAGRTRLE